MRFLCILFRWNFLLKNVDFLTKTVTYQTATATIFMTDSFKHWQKLTKGTPLFPILPNIIPANKGIQVQFLRCLNPKPTCFASLLWFKVNSSGRWLDEYRSLCCINRHGMWKPHRTQTQERGGARPQPCALTPNRALSPGSPEFFSFAIPWKLPCGGINFCAVDLAPWKRACFFKYLS